MNDPINLNLTTDLAVAGAVFNESSALLNQGITSANLSQYTADLQAVNADISAMLSNNAFTVGGQAVPLSDTDVAALSTMQGLLGGMVNEAQYVLNSDNPASGPPGYVALANLVNDSQSVLATVAGDDALAQGLQSQPFTVTDASGAQTTEVGFQADGNTHVNVAPVVDPPPPPAPDPLHVTETDIANLLQAVQQHATAQTIASSISTIAHDVASVPTAQLGQLVSDTLHSVAADVSTHISLDASHHVNVSHGADFSHFWNH
jgi:hypothetical protein